ncbi:MAG: hypothetical protein HY259_14455 [Chloroflexi bacterium]|nr:hypothetical protein [Chloroflexota bacterium]
MTKKKLSHDQKRKQRLQKRAAQSGGAARQTDPLDALRLATEKAIHQAFLTADQRLLDADVVAALNRLTVDVQKGLLAVEVEAGQPAPPPDRLVNSVKQRWAEANALAALPRLRAAQGLQEMVQHVAAIRAPGESQSYLRFLQGTMQSLGAGPGAPAESQPEMPARPNDWSADERRLLDLGLAWLRASAMPTWEDFRAEAVRMTDGGQAQAVANVCQTLYGQAQAEPVERILRPLLDAAHARISDGLAENNPPISIAQSP